MATGVEKSRSDKRPFVATHFRSDGLPAMLYSINADGALYRVRWFENGKLHENTLVRPAATFRALFAEQAA